MLASEFYGVKELEVLNYSMSENWNSGWVKPNSISLMYNFPRPHDRVDKSKDNLWVPWNILSRQVKTTISFCGEQRVP